MGDRNVAKMYCELHLYARCVPLLDYAISLCTFYPRYGRLWVCTKERQVVWESEKTKRVQCKTWTMHWGTRAVYAAKWAVTISGENAREMEATVGPVSSV